MRQVPVNKTIALIAACATLLMVSACKEKPAGQPPTPRPILEQTTLRFPAGHPQLASLGTVVAEAARPIEYEMPARVVWDEDRTQRIYPAFAGRVASIDADLGRSVRPGSVLAELASPDFGVAQAEAARASADLAQAQRHLTRQRELNTLGIVARKDLEQAETDALRAQAELDRAQARTRLYGSGAGVNQKLAIVAGIQGIVVERNLNPGQELRPEQFGPGSPALFVLTDPTRMWLQIDVRESELAMMTTGRPLEFVPHAYPDRRMAALIHASGDAIDPVSRTIKVRARIDNADRSLKVEMLGKVRIAESPGEGVTVPAQSVFMQDGAYWVYVEKSKGVFEPRQVKAKPQGSTSMLIRSGLSAGEAVVANNVLLLARQYRGAQERLERGEGQPGKQP